MWKMQQGIKSPTWQYACFSLSFWKLVFWQPFKLMPKSLNPIFEGQYVFCYKIIMSHVRHLKSGESCPLSLFIDRSSLRTIHNNKTQEKILFNRNRNPIKLSFISLSFKPSHYLCVQIKVSLGKGFKNNIFTSYFMWICVNICSQKENLFLFYIG